MAGRDFQTHQGGQAVAFATRGLRHRSILIGSAPAALQTGEPRNHFLVYNPILNGTTVFIGGDTVATAGADGVTFSAQTGFALEEGMTIEVDLSKLDTIFAVSETPTWVTIWESF